MIHPPWTAQVAGTANPGVLRLKSKPTRPRSYIKAREGASVLNKGEDGARPGANGGNA